ncbi:histone H1 [Mucilaginibacter sp. ZT4R22]|uniref:Histone H1 n=1 Tax=Mucilaginibacter pankratovii TaxID=2772110 RepID=A0ABR7WUJ7_9SPHI|nr:histone H1 [Mucilaginibacter pankratovii]MBD1365970.1 histone H1 [Mucilaginibacter pankratovii]
MAKFAQLKSLIANAEQDADKFYNNDNHAAGTRLRNSLQQIKKVAQEIRQEVSELKVSSKK